MADMGPHSARTSRAEATGSDQCSCRRAHLLCGRRGRVAPARLLGDSSRSRSQGTNGLRGICDPQDVPRHCRRHRQQGRGRRRGQSSRSTDFSCGPDRALGHRPIRARQSAADGGHRQIGGLRADIRGRCGEGLELPGFADALRPVYPSPRRDKCRWRRRGCNAQRDLAALARIRYSVASHNSSCTSPRRRRGRAPLARTNIWCGARSAGLGCVH